MRLTFGSGYDGALADLERASTELIRRQQEVSSGRRVNVPSDDPSSMAAAVQERAQIESIDRYVRATDSVGSRLAVVDTVLSDLIGKVTEARASGSLALGSNLTTEQREATARNIEALRDAILGGVNTTFRGTYLFAGAAALTQPYDQAADGTISGYLGDPRTTSVDIDRTRSVQVAFSGDAILRGTDDRDLLATLTSMAAAIRATDRSGVEEALTDLESGFNRLVRVQSGIGADLSALDDQRLRLGEMRRANAAQLSKDEDANMAESITAMKQADTVYQAALNAVASRTRLSLLDFLS